MQPSLLGRDNPSPTPSRGNSTSRLSSPRKADRWGGAACRAWLGAPSFQGLALIPAGTPEREHKAAFLNLWVLAGPGLITGGSRRTAKKRTPSRGLSRSLAPVCGPASLTLRVVQMCSTVSLVRAKFRARAAPTKAHPELRFGAGQPLFLGSFPFQSNPPPPDKPHLSE